MSNNTSIKKEIRVIILAFTILGMASSSLLLFVSNQTYMIHVITKQIYNHPLKVSNAALGLKSEVLKLNRNIKDILLVSSKEEKLFLTKDIKRHEEHIAENMAVIEKNILGEEGKKLYQETNKLLTEYQVICAEITTLVNNNQIQKAEDIVKTRNLDYVLKLEISASTVYQYAQNKVIGFLKESDTIYKKFKFTKFLTIITLLAFFIFIAYVTTQRIIKYINKNNHLKGVLAVIRDVNQLIVREKNKEKLIQESCNILSSEHVFEAAWIVLFDKDNRVDYIAGTDVQKNFSLLEEKIRTGWTPTCIQKTVENSNQYSFIEKTADNCLSCPLADLYGGKSALNVALKHNEKVFGYLTLSLESNYIQYNEEIELLEEVAGDIAYALNNLEVEKSVVDLKELYENIIDSVENLIFVKDTAFNYIACNGAFERFVGKSKDEIIGKSDYDIVDKEFADFFRENDKKMLAEKKAKSNFEWVVYPDGSRVYLLTVKSPLINSQGEVIGLVGNSVDLTQQKNTEKLFQESEEKFKLLMKESPSVIEIYDLQGNQIEVNHAYEKLWEIPASSTLHKFNLFKSEEVKRTGLLEYVKRAYEGESVTIPVYEFDSRGSTEAQGHGRVRKLNTRIYPLKDASDTIKNIVITHEDVTDKENFLIALQQKKKELETIIKESPNPIILHSNDGKILMLNQAWIDATGYSMKETPTVYDFIDKMYQDADMKDYVTKHVQSLYTITSKVDEGEFTFTNKNKERLTWQFNSAPLGVIDGKRTVISSAMDITELKRKDELMIAQSRHAAMGEMIGMIAHQWRQPLSVVSMIANNMLLDVALEEFDATKAKEASNQILEQTKHLSQTIDDFRNFFKPDKEVSKVKMQNIINETLSIVKDSLTNNDIEFKILNQSESEIDAYPRELMQVFVNIISNAKDALVTKKMKDAFIEVTIYEDKHYVYTQICDNGGRIDENILPKIFDPYFTTKDEKTGTGLGLYMSKMIIEEHLHGNIEVVNIENGVCFTVKLLKNGDINAWKRT